MATKTIRLTDAQHRLLIKVLANGFGDGDAFGANDDDPFRYGFCKKKDIPVWNRLVEILDAHPGSGVYQLDPIG